MAQSRMNTDNPVTLSIPRENRKTTTTKFRVTEERKDGSKGQITHRPPELCVQALSVIGGERETPRRSVFAKTHGSRQPALEVHTSS